VTGWSTASDTEVRIAVTAETDAVHVTGEGTGLPPGNGIVPGKNVLNHWPSAKPEPTHP
jgi:hypothetical protein